MSTVEQQGGAGGAVLPWPALTRQNFDNPLGGNNGHYESLNQIRMRTIPTLKKTGDAGVSRCVNGKFEKQLPIPIQSS
jgi:hypothetical protein